MRTVINGQDVYLDGDNIPEFTYSLNELTDFTKVRGSSSTTFEVPASNSARVGLGGPAMQEQAIGEVPIRIGEGGQVLFEGVCKPMEWTEDSVQVVAYGDNATWFDRAKSTKCVDVDMGLTLPMSMAVVSAFWQAEQATNLSTLETVNYSFPLIDYGSMGSFTGSTSVTLDKIRFAASVRALLEKFFKDNGFTLKVKGTLAALWPRLMLPSASHNYQVSDFVQVASASQTILLSINNYQVLPFQTGIIGLDTIEYRSGLFDPLISPNLNVGSFFSTINAVPDVNVTVSVTGRFTIVRDASTVNSGTSLRFRLYNQTDSSLFNEVIIAEVSIPVPPGIGTFSIDLDQQLFVGANIENAKTYAVSVAAVPFTQSVTTGYQGCQLYMEAGTTITFTGSPVTFTELIDGVSFKVSSAISPSLNIGDVISALANILRLVITTDQLTNTVTFQHYDDYLLDVSAGVDWSDRLSHNDLPAKVMPEVPERYLFKYTSDDKDERLLNYNGEAEWTAEGRYDTTGREDEKVTTVKFAATQQGTRFGGVVVPVIKEVDKVTDYVKCKPRILVHGGYSVPGGTVVTLSGVGGLNYAPRYYFSGSGGLDINLGFGDDVGRIGTLNRYWRASLLRATKPYLRGEFRVYDDEFMNFEFARPRLVNDGYGSVWMYVQTIKGKRFGDDDLVECDLIPV
jgi:hypothetical protein